MTASRDELIQSICPGMKLDKAFFRRIYGYEITWPGFAEEALDKLESAGCSRARSYYAAIVQEADAEYEKTLKEAGAWYLKELEK